MTIVDDITAADLSTPSPATNFNVEIAQSAQWTIPGLRDEYLGRLHAAAAATVEVDLERWGHRLILGTGQRILPIALRALGEDVLAHACQHAQTHAAMAEATWAALEAFHVDGSNTYEVSDYNVSPDVVIALAWIAAGSSDVVGGWQEGVDGCRAGDAASRVASYLRDQCVLVEACRVAMDAYQAEGFVLHTAASHGCCDLAQWWDVEGL